MKCSLCNQEIAGTSFPTERDGPICRSCNDLYPAILEALDGVEATVRRIRPHLPNSRKGTTPLSTSSALISKVLRSPALEKRLEDL